jgi:hypothetical protein
MMRRRLILVVSVLMPLLVLAVVIGWAAGQVLGTNETVASLFLATGEQPGAGF